MNFDFIAGQQMLYATIVTAGATCHTSAHLQDMWIVFMGIAGSRVCLS